MMKRARTTAILAAILLLAGCETVDNVFGDAKDEPFTGERLSILQLQKELVPNPALEAYPVTLPDSWTNQLWPQAGGYPTHAMGHLAIGNDLKKAWTVSIGKGGGREPLTAAPVVADNIVYTLDTEGEVSAYALEDGDRKWRVSVVPEDEDDTGAIGGGVAFDSATLYVTAGYRQLIALDAMTGKEKWKVTTTSPGRAAPSILDGRVYLTTIDNKLMVYDALNGNLLWQYAGVSETTNLLGSASPAVDPALAVLPLSSGEIYGLNPNDGSVLWQDNLSAVRRTGTMSSIADIRGLPVIDQGVVFAVSYSGRLVALDAANGQRLWQREIGSAETPWPAGDTLFVLTSEQQLVAIKRQTGDIHWVTAMPRGDDASEGTAGGNKGTVWAGPVLAGGRLILVSSQGDMAEVDPATGGILRTTDIHGDVLIAPVVAGNTLLVLDTDGDLAAYR